MKKLFSIAFALPIILSLNAFAQDAEYSNDESSEQKIEIQNQNKPEKKDYFSNLQPVEVEPKRKSFYVGAHLGVGFAGTYANEKAKGAYYNPSTDKVEVAEKDPFEDYLGFVFDLGAVFLFNITDMFTLAPELLCHGLNYSKESEVWYLKRSFGESAPLEENMTLIDVSIPVMLRAYFLEKLYAEAGVQFNLNAYGSFTLENSTYSYSTDVGEWSGEFFGVGLNLGFGYSFNVLTSAYDVGARFSLDLTRMEEDSRVYNEANASYRDAVATKAWSIEIFLNFYR